MARRSWPVAANPVSGALTWDGGLTQTLLAVSVVTATEAVTWTGGATTDRWPISVNLGTAALTYS